MALERAGTRRAAGAPRQAPNGRRPSATTIRAARARRRPTAVTLVVAAPLLCLLAFVMAAVEVEIEGPYGWAEKLPTPYRVSGPVARSFGPFWAASRSPATTC